MELTSPFYKGEYNSSLGDLYAATCRLDLAKDAYEAALEAAEINGDGEKYDVYNDKLIGLSTMEPCS